MAEDDDAPDGAAPGAGRSARTSAPRTSAARADTSPPPAAPVVLITRPEPDGAAFAEALRRAAPGPWRAVLAPLVRIVPQAVPDPPERVELILTSRNAVHAWRRSGIPPAMRGRAAWCVGEATARAAREAGLVPVAAGEGPANGADALVARIVERRPRAPLLHLRGEHARGEVAARLRAAGLDAAEAVVYRQEALGLDPRARAALAGATVIAPVFSPRAAALLSRAAPDASPAAIHAVALSGAVAEALALPRARVTVSKRPDAEAMIEALVPLLRHGTGDAAGLEPG